MRVFCKGQQPPPKVYQKEGTRLPCKKERGIVTEGKFKKWGVDLLVYISFITYFIKLNKPISILKIVKPAPTNHCI